MDNNRPHIIENDRVLSAAIGITWSQARESGRECADQAVAGYVAFNGTTWTPVGRRGIDWSGKHHHHNQWPAQLNRFPQLHALASAFAESGETRYAEAAFDYLDDWMRAHPVHEGWAVAAHDNTLNLPIRLKIWTECLPRFLVSQAFSDAFLCRLFDSIATQLNWLLKNLKGRGNWYIVQADALLTVGLRLDFLPDAATWRARGVKVLNETYRRQILPDGAHIECNPSYHGWMRRLYEDCWRLGRARPDLGLAITAEAVVRMWEYMLAATRPNGQQCAIHDGIGRHTGARSADWTKDRSRFLREAGLPDAMPTTRAFFPHAKQAFLRDGWGEDATYLTFDASPFESAHWHAGRNSIQLHAHGRSLIVDPGTFTYEGSDPFQAYGVSTRAHSTLAFNGWDQTWSTQNIEYRAAPGYDLVHSLYDGGYWKGAHRGGYFLPGHEEGFHAEHHRTLFWIHGRAIVVMDHVYQTPAKGKASVLESVWQLSPGEVVVEAEQRRAFTRHADGNVLMLFPLLPEGGHLVTHEGETDPLRGWVPGDVAARKHHPAPQVVARVGAFGLWNADLVTVLVPFPGTRMPAVVAEASATEGSGSQANHIGSLTLRWGDGSTDEVVWYRRLARAIFQHPTLDTDACLVHVQKDAGGQRVRGLAVDATYCEPHTTGTRDRLETFTF